MARNTWQFREDQRLFDTWSKSPIIWEQSNFTPFPVDGASISLASDKSISGTNNQLGTNNYEKMKIIAGRDQLIESNINNRREPSPKPTETSPGTTDPPNTEGGQTSASAKKEVDMKGIIGDTIAQLFKSWGQNNDKVLPGRAYAHGQFKHLPGQNWRA